MTGPGAVYTEDTAQSAQMPIHIGRNVWLLSLIDVNRS